MPDFKKKNFLQRKNTETGKKLLEYIGSNIWLDLPSDINPLTTGGREDGNCPRCSNAVCFSKITCTNF